MSAESSFETGLRFAQIVTGTTISEEPPSPASPLGRLMAFAAVHGTDVITPEHVALAMEGKPLAADFLG
ncbi:hypothetical protein FDI81_gp01 [Streptomyces phage Hydra]|uniref:Uncharacterized protein n=1 Tax=Streptomyces phage Hydra TaxID=1690428 RepID=A0A0K1Y8W9_9CAUD|nr:hypothetical protein FDI81_gp01 [Streptomyces phage Hydra]AKY03532.1 hypothetical protein SEA_HYDRA_1 [Streptomyces phage Hydra]UJQ86419.1 hypothetical protein SEA_SUNSETPOINTE_1 [Streptomyces phage SunsetPointe]URQ04916.1 hypothetical protein SEA_LEGACY_1 [Streptomyces phage Legacy]